MRKDVNDAFPIFLDGLIEKTGGGSPTTHRQMITFPNKPGAYTLQVLQVMKVTPPYNAAANADIYYQCADIELTMDGAPAADGGVAGDARRADGGAPPRMDGGAVTGTGGAGGSVGAGGTGGSGGSGGSAGGTGGGAVAGSGGSAPAPAATGGTGGGAGGGAAGAGSAGAGGSPTSGGPAPAPAPEESGGSLFDRGLGSEGDVWPRARGDRRCAGLAVPPSAFALKISQHAAVVDEPRLRPSWGLRGPAWRSS